MNDTILSKIQSPADIQRSLATAFREARKSRKHSRREASIRTGVPEATIRRFEDTGQISLRQFLMLCDIYGRPLTVDSLFPKSVPQSMDQLLALDRTGR